MSEDTFDLIDKALSDLAAAEDFVEDAWTAAVEAKDAVRFAQQSVREAATKLVAAIANGRIE